MSQHTPVRDSYKVQTSVASSVNPKMTVGKNSTNLQISVGKSNITGKPQTPVGKSPVSSQSHKVKALDFFRSTSSPSKDLAESNKNNLQFTFESAI
jgi:hypothetical protein